MRKLPRGFRHLPSGAVGWRVSVDGRKYSGSEPDLARARRARAQAEANAGGRPTERPTVDELLSAFIADADRSATTISSWNWAKGFLPQPFLDRTADDVTPQIVYFLWRQLKESETPPHALVKLSNVCSKAWQDGVGLNLVTANPWREVDSPQPPASKKVTPPSESDVRTLIDAFRDRPALALWLRVASRIGTRGGELCGLQWDDIDTKRSEISIERSITRGGEVTEGKTGIKGHRVIPVDLPTMQALKKHERIVGCPWVFSHDGLEPWRPDYVATAMRRMCEKIDIDISPHDLRHFAVTQWLGDGVAIPTVAYLVGDNSATVMRTYAHQIPAQGREAVERLAARLDA